MMTVRHGCEDQWRRFQLSRDIPTEFVGYVDDLATHMERRLDASRGFDEAARTAFAEVDASKVPNPERFNTSVAITMLLDLWAHATLLRAWLNEQIDKALDAVFPAPPSKLRRTECYW